MKSSNRLMLALATSLALASSLAHAQDSGPLIDKLVQKGILTDQEAEDLRADLVKDFQTSSAGKLNISSPVTELKLYGDGRIRYQYDDQQPQKASPDNVTQRSRFRYRLRLNADFRLTNNFFGGIQLQTGQASDSGNETVQPGYSNSSIYINRVFLGANISDWGTVVIGKQKNPFYTTDLVWDPDVSPYGLTESISLDRLFATRGTPAGESATGYSKDGKKVVSYTTGTSGSDWGAFKLSFVAGQLVYDTNNNESLPDGDAKNDAFQFVGQFVVSYEFSSKTSATFAPGFMIYNAADAGDSIALNNETSFSGASGYVDRNGDGIADFSLSGFNLTVTPGSISGETRDLAIVTAPGEVKFPIGSLNGRFYWDFAYNTAGSNRYKDVYGFGLLIPSIGPADEFVLTKQRSFTTQDAIAWLVGFEVGQGKGEGAWTLFANYRETGIASIDPNLNDSDFALGRLNSRGFKFGATYGVTDAISLGLTGFITYNLDDQLADQFGLANRNAVNTVQIDLNFKF